MTRTTSPTNPTNLSTLLRKPDRPMRYWWPIRWNDILNGRRDGRTHQGGPGPAREHRLSDEGTAWLRHNGHRLRERQQREELTYQALALPLQTRRDTLDADLTDAHTALHEAQTALDAIDDAPDQIRLQQRRATEATTAPEIVAMRRRREYHADVVAPAQARLDAARATVTTLQRELNQVQSTLDALQDVLTVRKAHLGEYHQRRATVYERSYLRRATGIAPIEHALQAL
jgi:hypothetical protein